MTRNHPAVIPFPKCREPLGCTSSAVCHFQAAAELRVALLHGVFDMLSPTDASTTNARYLRECCDNARGMLHDVVVLYRHSLAQARRRATDE